MIQITNQINPCKRKQTENLMLIFSNLSLSFRILNCIFSVDSPFLLTYLVSLTYLWLLLLFIGWFIVWQDSLLVKQNKNVKSLHPSIPVYIRQRVDIQFQSVRVIEIWRINTNISITMDKYGNNTSNYGSQYEFNYNCKPCGNTWSRDEFRPQKCPSCYAPSSQVEAFGCTKEKVMTRCLFLYKNSIAQFY